MKGEPRKRPVTENPHNPQCAFHLRRVCGVCKHFAGHSMRDKGRCEFLGYNLSGGRNAAECEHWTRKVTG